MPFLELTQIDQREMLPGCHARFVHTDNVTVSYWDLEEGAIIPDHGHSHEQVTSVIEGDLMMTVDGECRSLGPGSVVVIPANGRHSVRALTECRVIDVFYPAREDYR